MENTTTQTRFSLYETQLSDTVEPTFLGADANLDHVVEEAVRLVSGRRYQRLHISDGEQIVVLVYRTQAGDTWVSTRAEDLQQTAATQEVLAGMEQMELPGLDWSKF